MDIFHGVQREMISNNNDLYFCNIGREEYSVSNQQIVLEK
jgi:hypothetical protein